MTDENTQGRRGTTTHAEWGAGHPRLLISQYGERFEHELTEDVVRIGSATRNELVLTDADPVHATINHDDQDEYVLTLHGAGEMNANPDAGGLGENTEILRTGARFTVGPWTLVYTREEFADHGRPFGGRQGGELSDQPSQPPRPHYSADAHASDNKDDS